jgi:IS5 family transposase
MTPDFFRARLGEMVNPKNPMVILSRQMPWEDIEVYLAQFFVRTPQPGRVVLIDDWFGTNEQCRGGGVSPAGRKPLPIRLMASLLYLAHHDGHSDEAVLQRWSESVPYQHFSGGDDGYYEHRKPCDASQISRFRQAIGEDGVEYLMHITLRVAVAIQAIPVEAFQSLIVDSTVQEKAIAHPTDSRLLEVARYHVIKAAQRVGFRLKQTFAQEARDLRRRAGGYAHARQFKRLRKVLRRQRTILGIVLRDIQRQRVSRPDSSELAGLDSLLERAERLRTQQPKDKNKLYALHAPEVECIGKGKARKPYEFGVKTGLATTHSHSLIVGARTFPGNPYDGHTLNAQLEQATILLEGIAPPPKTVYVDLGYRGADQDNPDIEIIHRGKLKSLTQDQRQALRRRQAIEPVIGHLKSDHRMDRCWLKGATGDALHTLLCAIGYNLRWLLRAIARLNLSPAFLRRLFSAFCRQMEATYPLNQLPTPVFRTHCAAI